MQQTNNLSSANVAGSTRRGMALQGRRRMPPTCSICRHPERAAIEEQHIKGTSLREIAKLHSGTTPWSLARHFKHIPAIIAKVTAHQVAQNVATGKLPARVEELIVEAQKILAGAKKKKQWSPALAALRENRALLELLGRLSGELRPGAVGDFVPGMTRGDAGAKGGIGLANRIREIYGLKPLPDKDEPRKTPIN